MKKIMTLILSLSLTLVFSGMAMAGTWDTKCIACHKDDNKMKASTKAVLLEKYKTADAFVKAGMESKNAMMKAQQKEDLLKEGAKDLGLK